MRYHEILLTAVLLVCELSAISGDESDAHSAVVEGINSFSKSLYQVLKEVPGNLVVSPFSVAAAVGMLLHGLQGNTAKHVSAALQLPEDLSIVGEGFKSLLQTLNESGNVTLEIANKIYLEKHFPIKERFLQDTENYFRSVAEKADISGNPEGVRRNVNNWAAERTNNKIQDLLLEGDVTPDVIMILLNAIYFKGLWKTSFDKTSTRQEVFHLNSNSRKVVSMMHLTAHLPHASLDDQNVQVLKLPYQGGKYSMLILLPNDVDGLQQLEANIQSLDLPHLQSNLRTKEVIVAVPRFKILQRIDLISPLTQLGMGELFDGTGNFSGISDVTLAVSKAVQKAFIEVNEEGTEAAAVTGLVVTKLASVNIRPIIVKFTADHPFLYMIVEEDRGTVLFLGRVVNP